MLVAGLVNAEGMKRRGILRKKEDFVYSVYICDWLSLSHEDGNEYESNDSFSLSSGMTVSFHPSFVQP